MRTRSSVQAKKSTAPLMVVGSGSPGGAYLLRLRVNRDLKLAFGRFQHGRSIAMPAGTYVYVGSARGFGAAPLARRLLRHATRSGQRPPHSIRAALPLGLRTAGLAPRELAPPAGKRLFWHVDYMLDQMEVELTHALLIRSRRDLEPELAESLAGKAYTRVVARGLGASDAAGRTHLLRVVARDGWWADLVREAGRFGRIDGGPG